MFKLPRKAHKATGSMGQPSVFSMSGGGISAAMEGLVPKEPNKLHELYRAIYKWDSVSGAACDLTAMIPFSDFSLAGVNDSAILHIYEDSLNHLDLRTNIAPLVVEYLTIGQVVGSLVFNESQGIFTDLIVQEISNCKLEQIPLQGYDPKIDLTVPSSFRKFLLSPDVRDVEARKELSPHLVKKLLSGKVALDPLTTLFLSRKTYPQDMGTSYLSRVIPFFMLEQILLAGTITGAQRRQRAIMHIMAGDEDWDPSESDLSELIEMFMSADLDPSGAIIATKNNVSVEEVRQGGDFWKVTDEWDGLTYAKMRALGISESFLSREATFNNMDAALSIFMESLIALRYAITRALFYTKLFPMLARVHRFVKRSSAELDHNIRITGTAKDIPISELVMPTVNWHKQLAPNYDMQYLDILATIQDQGVPVPLRTWAAAGGMAVDKITESLDDDIELRTQFKDWEDRKAELGGDDAGGDADAWGSTENLKVKRAERLARFMTSKKEVKENKMLKVLGQKIPVADKHLLSGRTF